MIESPHLLTIWILNLSKEKDEERKYQVSPESLITAYHLQYYQSEDKFSMIYEVDKWRMKTMISRTCCEAQLIYLEQAKILWTHRPDIDFIINQIGSCANGDLWLNQKELDQFLLILEYHPKYLVQNINRDHFNKVQMRLHTNYQNYVIRTFTENGIMK